MPDDDSVHSDSEPELPPLPISKSTEESGDINPFSLKPKVPVLSKVDPGATTSANLAK
jgi:hypothetical protein